jgi:hypothetical protein
MKIVPSPNKVVYLGYILFTYNAPGATGRQGRTTYYKYETNVSVDFDRETLPRYLLQKGGDAWLTMGIVEYGKK